VHDPGVRSLLGRFELHEGAVSRWRSTGVNRPAEAQSPTDEELVSKWRFLNPDLEPPVELLE
jgi:hypothetical protein